MKFVVLGDIQVEFTSQLNTPFADIESDLLLYPSIVATIGGTGCNFALAARELDQEVVLAGAVGDDVQADAVESALRRYGIRTALFRKTEVSTGLALCVRDGSTQSTRGLRLLLIADPSAVACFDESDALALRPELADADFLVVDGYAFRSESRRRATLSLMGWARAAGVTVSFDVVPHDCFKTKSLETLQIEAVDATVIVVEARTLNALAGDPWTDGDTSEVDAQRAASIAEQVFRDRRVFLRFGAGNADQTLLLSPGEIPTTYSTGYVHTDDPRGFGDRLLAQELVRIGRT